ncbi:MAG: class I SAM-dependent methyltransferase [Pseudomonadota bacterium]
MTIDTLLLSLLIAVLIAQLLLLYRSFSATKGQRKIQVQMQLSVKDEVRGLFNQFESYQFLRDRLNLRQGMPYTRDWSASPDFLKLIVEHCLEDKPATVVECSSGLTTVMLARCCELNGAGEVISLENGAGYAAKTREHVARYGLQQQSTVIDAPLQRYAVAGTEYDWYAIEALPDKGINMLVIDGPPGFIQEHSRYPALPLLFDKLADGCVIFMDDAARPDEKEIVRMWQAQFPGLVHRYVNTERGCSILSINK